MSQQETEPRPFRTGECHATVRVTEQVITVHRDDVHLCRRRGPHREHRCYACVKTWSTS